MTAPEPAPAVLVGERGRAGHLRLNRPEALNALTLDMVRTMAEALDRWEDDPGVGCVVITGSGRALCAGGDIRAIYEAARTGDRGPATFWREEYALDARISRYPKPILAIMDGLVMGGGVGISAHASHRVVTERSLVAMPEVGIGFAPDVGGTWLLSRAPGELGTHLALTAGRVAAADAIHVGLADRFVPVGALEGLIDRCAAVGPDVALDEVSAGPGPPTGAELPAAPRAWIDACYAVDAVEEILERLDRRAEPAAAEAASAIRAASPTSLKVTLRALREARGRSLEDCLEAELRISCAFLDTPDLVEGVRAAVIDKDRSPSWSPARLDEVGEAALDRFFTRTPPGGDPAAPATRTAGPPATTGE